MKIKSTNPIIDPGKQLLDTLDTICNCTDFADNSLDMLVELVEQIRPRTYLNMQYAQDQIISITQILENDLQTRDCFRTMLKNIFVHPDISEMLTESGLNSEHNFLRELDKRIRYKILPPLRRRGSFLNAINVVFYKKTDHLWLEDIEDHIWVKLFEIIEFEIKISDEKILYQLYKALSVTSSRISSLGVDPEIQRFLSEDDQLIFVRQSRTSLNLINLHNERNGENPQIYRRAEAKLQHELNHCDELIKGIENRISSRGTSLHQTYIMLRIRQLTERMRLIIDIANNDETVDLFRVVRHFKNIVHNENTKTSIHSLIRNNIEFISYRIAEHARNTGEHYITVTRADYRKMFRSAMGGGIIISFVAIIKSLLHLIRMAPFWQGFAYSLNYATGFIAIYATGATLATKQPAMTASAIASSMENKNKDTPNMAELAILISEVMRSQTASFVGNLMIVFPLTLVIAYLWSCITGSSIVDGAAAQVMLDDQNPLRSLSILYACFTGVFLYLSGIISGYFDNLALYGNIPDRLREHPYLKRRFTHKTIDRIAKYTGKHLGGIMGNLSLGFFLGMAGFVGSTFGISFDIRHITISTGNFAIGLQGVGFDIPTSEIVWITAGVLLIGFLNFLVSFSLAFFTALASRKVRFKYYKQFAIYLRRLIIRYPLDFIRPPKTPRKPSELEVVK